MQCKMINLTTANATITNRHETKNARSFHQNKGFKQKKKSFKVL